MEDMNLDLFLGGASENPEHHRAGLILSSQVVLPLSREASEIQ
jgi:hypothetical protein